MRYLLSFFCGLVFSALFGQTSSLLWEISGKNLKKPSYVYGTMHVKDKRVFQFGDSVMVKFNQCKLFAGELVLDMDSKTLGEAMKLSMMPGDTTLSMLLSKEEYELVKKEAKKKLGNNALIIDKMKPFLSSALFTEASIPDDSSNALDSYLQKLAKSRGMKVVGLETAKEQLAAIDQMTLKEQALLLLNTVKDEKKSGEELDQMFEDYLKQDLEALEKHVNAYDMPDAFNKSVVKKRNYVMADRIPKLIGKQPTFIAIGAAHLPGKEGVLELLRKKGYKLRPVISAYSGTDVKSEKIVPSTWVLYKTDSFQVHFPAEPKITEESDQQITSVYVLEPGTDNLFSLTYYSKLKKDQTSDQYFDDLIKEFNSSKSKIISSEKGSYKGFPSMEIEVEEGISRIRMKYYFLKEKIVEISVTADKEEVRSENSEAFLNSFVLNK